DLVLDLAPLGGAELGRAARRLALLLDASAFQPRELRWHEPFVVAEAGDEVVVEEQVGGRELDEQGLVEREPSPRMAHVADARLGLAKGMLGHRARDRLALEPRRRRGEEADDTRAGGEKSHGGRRS